ncbi:hypothetical protein BC829DRAFT_142871 [Chytridium lagenaria]|nr:hypothetical protein BC829DRAFT_142871 [Chytridium lagenaria]
MDLPRSRRLEEKSMTPAELYTGLCEVVSNGLKTSVLLLDVRPKEVYIDGHIKWKNNLTFGALSGLVNLEPDWITTGMGPEDIERLLKGFSSYSDLSIAVFEKRSEFDLIVVYDGVSTCLRDSPVLTALVEALYVKESSRPLKLQPILLSGGYSEWLNFVRSQGSSQAEWVEIGDGTQPIIAFDSIQPAIANKITPSISYPLKTFAPVEPQPQSLSYIPSYQPTFASRQFDNPFLNFNQYEMESARNPPGASNYSNYGAKPASILTYPSLPENTYLATTAPFNRSASNPIFSQPTSYPALLTLTSQMSDISIAPTIPQKQLNQVLGRSESPSLQPYSIPPGSLKTSAGPTDMSVSLTPPAIMPKPAILLQGSRPDV